MNPANYLVLSAVLFTIGAAGVLLRRNAIVMFMCVELMLNAANLAFVTFSRMHGHLDGQVVAFFTMVVAASEVVVGLAIIMTIFRTRRIGIGGRRKPVEALTMTSGVWLLIALPLAGAAVLLLGGKATDAWGHLLGCATVCHFVRCRVAVVLQAGRPGIDGPQYR